MDAKIFDIYVWRSARTAKAEGFTHRARLFSIVPGFCESTEGGYGMRWASRSDLLDPIVFILIVIATAVGNSVNADASFFADIYEEL